MIIVILRGRGYTPDTAGYAEIVRPQASYVEAIVPRFDIFDDFEREARAIHKPFLTPFNDSAFPAPRRAYQREKEVVREPCQLVKERCDPTGRARVARLNPFWMKPANAEKTRGSAFGAGPRATRRAA